jgi:hypothetical protein
MEAVNRDIRAEAGMLLRHAPRQAAIMAHQVGATITAVTGVTTVDQNSVCCNL